MELGRKKESAAGEYLINPVIPIKLVLGEFWNKHYLSRHAKVGKIVKDIVIYLKLPSVLLLNRVSEYGTKPINFSGKGNIGNEIRVEVSIFQFATRMQWDKFFLLAPPDKCFVNQKRFIDKRQHLVN